MVSSVDLVEGTCIPETAVPYFVHDLLRMGLIFAGRSCLDGQNGSSTNAFLVLLSKLPLASSEELTSPSAFSTERTGPDLKVVR
jgi:hypothetical protein